MSWIRIGKEDMFALFRLSTRIFFERVPCISNIDDCFRRASAVSFADSSGLDVSCLSLLYKAFHMLLIFLTGFHGVWNTKLWGLAFAFHLADNRISVSFLLLLWPLLHTKRAFGYLDITHNGFFRTNGRGG